MGGSGFIGSKLGEALANNGWEINLLTRNAKAQSSRTSFPCTLFQWTNGEIPPLALENVAAIINLTGQPIADQYWTSAYKAKILSSRIDAVKALKRALMKANLRPEVIIQASAIGYYGFDRQDPLDEGAKAGSGFLAETCEAWENEAQGLAAFSRLCIARIGLVLDWGGGVFSKLHDIYSTGLGGILGKGNQKMNWIHMVDLVNFFIQAIDNKNYTGPFNLVSPDHSSNKTFHQELSRYTPSFSKIKVPALALKLLLGERSVLLLGNVHTKPAKLINHGFHFAFPTLDQCLENLFAHSRQTSAHVLEYRQWLPVSLDESWDFMSNAENLEQITPPWLKFKVLKTSTPHLGEGTTIDYRLKLHYIPLKWRSVISSWNPRNGFTDEQLIGPYQSWYHKHTFSSLKNGTLIVDRVEYSLPLFPFGQIAFLFVRSNLAKIFAYRQIKMGENLIKINHD